MSSRMPALFVGHGSPMNAIEENDFSRGWEHIAREIPRPQAILSVSAHWYVPGSRINDSTAPNLIYDMYGFPKALYEVSYPAPGAPELAASVQRLLPGHVATDNSWGIDHGTWSVLRRMYPAADIPVTQLSIDRRLSAAEHYRMGRALGGLRDEGVLILGTGNVVHNLALVNWHMDGGFAWNDEFDGYIRDRIIEGDHESVINHHSAGASAKMAFTTMEHYYPLLYVLGASAHEDRVRVFNEAAVLGSISMTSYVMG